MGRTQKNIRGDEFAEDTSDTHVRLLPGTHPIGGEILDLDRDHQREWENQSPVGSDSLHTWNLGGDSTHSAPHVPLTAPKQQWQCGIFRGRQGLIYSPFLSPSLSLLPTPTHTHRETYDTQWHGWPVAQKRTRSSHFPRLGRNRPLPTAHHDTNQKCTHPNVPYN